MSINVQVKSSNGIALVPIESRLLSSRKVFVEGEITNDMACEFVKKIMVLVNEDRNKPIDILINSPGGDINAGLLMYDVIQSIGTEIRMFCMGRAYSMAAVLFASGPDGRYVLPNSELMLHQPLIASCSGGNASSIKSISDSLMEAKNKLSNILAKHTGKTAAEIDDALSYDHYFNAEESVAFGLADKIVDFNAIMEE